MSKLLTKNTACLIERMEAHAKADEIIKGKYWEDGKGCFVGCALHSSDHSQFPEQLGWPESLPHLCDALFESLSAADAKQFAVDLPKAVGRDGKDLSMIVPHWLYWLLADPVDGVIRFVQKPQFAPQKAAIEAVAELHRRQISGGVVTSQEWAAAREAARAAGDAAGAAARKRQAAKLMELLEAAQ